MPSWRLLSTKSPARLLIRSSRNCEDAVTESNSDTLNQSVDYEDYMFYQNVDHSFVHRLGRQDLTVATINVEENYTKSHFDESVDSCRPPYPTLQ